ncbi:MAG TPA: pyridoxamine 5'-phosphate oxidase family protein [Candidatus Limnocylindrales bacterium]|nr:pyridoxamine 5'-phosphate oxidase family protein [Candidatus Limnocylindrales bacterium]
MSAKGVLSGSEINALLHEAAVGHLALCKENIPYIVPLNFVYSEGEIYFHCAPRGRKTEYMHVNPNVCFQVEAIGELISAECPCSFTYSYRSILVEGTVHEVGGSEAKEAVLQKIADKYAGAAGGVVRVGSIGAMSLQQIEQVRVYRLKPCVVTGKKGS